VTGQSLIAGLPAARIPGADRGRSEMKQYQLGIAYSRKF
jgi:hypothetical protein